MNYQELIAKALHGRSVNSAAKAWGIPQPSLRRYVQAERLPDFDLAERIITEAGVDPAEGFKILAEEARSQKSKNFKLQSGFVQTSLLFHIATGGVFLILYIMSNHDLS